MYMYMVTPGALHQLWVLQAALEPGPTGELHPQLGTCTTIVQGRDTHTINELIEFVVQSRADAGLAGRHDVKCSLCNST
jgi:hypothetical protein